MKSLVLPGLEARQTDTLSHRDQETLSDLLLGVHVTPARVLVLLQVVPLMVKQLSISLSEPVHTIPDIPGEVLISFPRLNNYSSIY